jgi:uncharacterized protein YbjT (DUF2867 family)
MVEQQTNILEAAKKAGVKYLVRVSGGKAVVGPNVASVVGRGHHAIEEAMNKSGMAWVNLRPGLFMQNLLGQAPSIKADSKIVVASPKDQPIAFIDVRDTGALGARIMLDPAPYMGKTIEFTGKLTNYGEFTDVFSQVLGRPISYVAITPEQAEQGMKSRNMPDWLVTHLVGVARTTASGGFAAENMQPIRDILKREPITTRKFVEDYKAAFS